MTNNSGSDTATLLADKKRLLTASIDSATRHSQIQRINNSLRSGLVDYELSIRNDLHHRLASLPYQNCLYSREYAANLFPAETMRGLFELARRRVVTQK